MPKPPTRKGGGAGRAARSRTPSKAAAPGAVSPTPAEQSVGRNLTPGHNPPVKPKRASPTRYSKALGERICARIIGGDHVRAIADEPGMPCASAIYAWLAGNEAFAAMYAKAKELQMGAMAEEILAIADDGRNDWVETDQGIKLDKEAVQRSKLRVDTRKWLLSKLAPKKYGDRVAVEASGPDGGPIKTENAPVTLPALDAVLAKLVKLSGGPKPDAEPEPG